MKIQSKSVSVSLRILLSLVFFAGLGFAGSARATDPDTTTAPGSTGTGEFGAGGTPNAPKSCPLPYTGAGGTTGDDLEAFTPESSETG